jgi:hypothetical protein
VEKGKQGYKVASIKNGAVHLAFQMISGKLVRKNRPTQVVGFVIDLTGKCIEGMQMNWGSYLINQLEKDCHEAQHQDYEFHFSWLLILIAFIAWEMLEGETFPRIEPSEPLATNFTTLWYSSNMEKKWQSNAVFHTYYLQLKRAIESFPLMTPNNIHKFRPLARFHTNMHFIYIIAPRDKHKEEIQSYYKLTEEDMKEITKEWHVEFLVPAEQIEPSDSDLIGNPVVTCEEYDVPNNNMKQKKEEVHELSNTSKEITPDSLEGGGGDEVDKEEDEGEEDK